MYTSYYANLKKIPSGLRPVAISIGIPGWFKGDRELRLAPTKAMLKMNKADYDRLFVDQLAKLDARQIAASLGDSAVLLCWEKPIVASCHRRCVAEWLESKLGIVVPELGFDRAAIPAYDDMPWEEVKPARASKKVMQPSLYD